MTSKVIPWRTVATAGGLVFLGNTVVEEAGMKAAALVAVLIVVVAAFVAQRLTRYLGGAH